ncbi:MAG: uroporphyrinogen decarboxylase family protein [Opitutaceae bacterium]
MTSKEKVMRALRHEPGPVPVDFGSTGVTGIHVSCVAALREHYGLPRHPVRVCEPFQMLGEIEDDLADALGSDCTGVGGRTTMFGFPNEGWHEWRTPWGQLVMVPEGFRVRSDGGGDQYLFPQGDVDVPPSGHMPASGYFFDAIIRQEPIDEEQLDPADNCVEFQPLSEADRAHWQAEIARVRGSTRAVTGGIGGTGFGDIALVPGPFLKQPKGIRDVNEWYVSLVERRDYVHQVFSHQCAVALENLAEFARIAADTIDVLFVCGTDFGTQNSQFCSVATFDDLYAPYYRRINDWVHQHTSWKTFKHSCGAMRPLLNRVIECGFDIINPVQCSAKGMEAAGLKADFGDRLVFWGGGVDTQQVLPFGSPSDVTAQVTERLKTFSPDGGFVFNTIHNIQARTPTANIVAMVDAIRSFNDRGG